MSVLSTYAFRARDAAGNVLTGTLSAASADEVGARLRAEGKFVLAVNDNAMQLSAAVHDRRFRRNDTARKVRREDVISFCQQLSVMLETGVPLTEGLDSFAQQSSNKAFCEVLANLRDAIHSGEALSVAMSRWPRVFPNMMISLMKASEASGTMAEMLGRVGEYLGKERRTARQIKGALGYPLFMMGTAVVMTVFLMAFVLPRFAKIYEMRSAQLPGPTRILLSMSHFVTSQYPIYGPIIGAVVIGLAIWVRHPSGKRAADWLRLHVPILKKMFSQLYITRAARTMATLLASGVNLLDIINICRGVTNNVSYNKLWDDMERGVREGKQISDAVFAAKFIPRNVASMIASGERSGRLSQVMERIAAFSEEELDAAVKSVTAYIEPCMIIFMGLMVGTVAMALLLPIFSMGKVLSGA